MSTLYVVRTQNGSYIFVGHVGNLSISTPDPVVLDVALNYARQFRSLVAQTGTQIETSNCDPETDRVVRILLGAKS